MFNLFRKNKQYLFYPNTACSGSGLAITEFNRYKEEIEKATGAKVNMVRNISCFGGERIVYEVVKDE